MIDILMATYNGELYIEDQILSLQSQSIKDWNLIVHDDGSTDCTLSIIKKYALTDSRIKILEDGILFKNASKNFFHLLQSSTAPYIIFCDQDDIWLENKLEEMLNILRCKNEHRPMAVFSDSYLYNAQRGVYGHSFSYKPQNLQQQLFLNAGLQGSSLMFNNSLKSIVMQHCGYMAMHDHILTLAALTFGQIYYINKKLMLYRQGHTTKLTQNVPNTFLKKVKHNLLSKNKVIDEAHYLSVKAFYNSFQNKINTNDVRLFEAYLNFYKTKSVLKRMKIILQNKFSLSGSQAKLLIKSLIRP